MTDTADRYHHAWDNRHRCGVLGKQDIESMVHEIDRLKGELDKPRLGCATTDEMLGEIRVRLALSQNGAAVAVLLQAWEKITPEQLVYRTVDS